MFWAVGYQKTEDGKQNFIACAKKKKAVITYDKFFEKKYFRICLLQYGGTTQDEYRILKQSENGEDKTYELLI